MDVNELGEIILKRRIFCRPPRGKSLGGIYLYIYQQVREQLLDNLAARINEYEPQDTYWREWANQQILSAVREVLDDDVLKKLALEVKGHSPNSNLRQYALRELVEAILLSGRLCHPHRDKFSRDFYELLYEEAVNETLIYVCKKIDIYDPNRTEKFMTWVNFRLDKQVIECRRKFSSVQQQDLPTLQDLENIPQPQETSPLMVIRQCLQEDGDNVFKKAYIRNRPDANFQAIALAVIADKSWKEIGEEFDIPVGTISSFYWRCCQKFKRKFIEYLS